MQKLFGGVAVIADGGKHLLIQQSFKKPNGGQWRHPGGKFNQDESYESGLIREIKEETGLDIILTKLEPIMVMECDYPKGAYFGFFVAKLTGGELKTEKREIMNAGWFRVSEIAGMNLMAATRKFYQKIYKTK